MKSTADLPQGVEVRAEITPAFAEILTPDALTFVAKLQRAFGAQRAECLRRRSDKQAALDAGRSLDFLPETKHIREGDWKCALIPDDLRDRRVENNGSTGSSVAMKSLTSY